MDARLRGRAGTVVIGIVVRIVVGIIVGIIVRIHLVVRRIRDVQALTGALRETMQFGVHIGQHPGAHDQRGRHHHDNERERDARGERARQPPGQGRTPRHWGSRRM